MAPKSAPQDQPPRDGGVDQPTDAQLRGATEDGSPPDPLTTASAPSDAGTPADVSAELATERDRTLRLRAELENVRSRAARELATELRYAAMPLARDLLPVIDNIGRAINAAEKHADAAALLEGFRMVEQQLASVLQRHHCEEIIAAGAQFDPQMHEAILQQPSVDTPADHVLMVTQKGYQMHDRVVRPAQVIVSSGEATG